MDSESLPAVPAAFLRGQRVDLRPVESADVSLLYAWANDPELRGLTGEVTPSTLADVEAYVDKIRTDPSRVWFMVMAKPGGCAIGECGLLRIFYPWRTADLSIILGDKAAWGQGYGAETMHLLLDYAFGCLSLHRVAIGVVGANTRALRFYTRLGFQQEGVQRDGYYFQHRYQDFIMMSILEHEFRARLAQAAPGQAGH